MIRRFVCLLLVPLLLANQGICYAHSHHGADFAESEDHASRPHFHFGGHDHHKSTHDHNADHSGCDHSHDDHDADLPPAIAPAGDHDADAVYCADAVTFARDGNTVIVLSAKDAAAIALRVADQSDDWLLRLGQPPSIFDAACPIFLRTLSLRI